MEGAERVVEEPTFAVAVADAAVAAGREEAQAHVAVLPESTLSCERLNSAEKCGYKIKDSIS